MAWFYTNSGVGFSSSGNTPAPPIELSGYQFQSNGTDNYIDLGFVPDDSTDMAFQVTYLDSTGKQISGSEEFGLGSSSGNLISIVNGVESAFDAIGEESKSLGLLSSGLAYVDGLENGTESTVTGATLNLYAMAKNASTGVNEHCAAVWERISWYHNGTHHYIDFTEGSGSTVTDNFGNEYTIQGTVSDSQWINYEKARRVLIDTDMEEDCDDTLALRLAAWAERKGYIDIVAMVMSNQTEGLQLAKAVDALMTFEGRPRLAIGVYHDALVIPGGSDYNAAVLEYPHTLADDEFVEPSLNTYRRTLQAAIDDGVKIDLFTIGTLRALAEFMKSLPSDGYPSGMDMINLAVNEMFTVGGEYLSGTEFNLNANAQTGLATQYVFENFPKKITFTGAAVGNEVVTGGNLKDVYPELGVDLVRDAYFAHGSEDGRRSWDPMSIYLASLNNPSQVGQFLTQGTNTATATGANTFTPSDTGPHFFLTNLKGGGYYVEPINEIAAKQNWPTRDDIGKYSIPRISTLMTLTNGELTQGGNNAGDVVSSFTVSDNEVSNVTVDFTSGANSNGYYAISGTDVLLTQSGADYLAIGGNQMPDISLTSNTGKTVYNRIETIGVGEFARYYTTYNGDSYMTTNKPIFLDRSWSMSFSVTGASSGDRYISGDPVANANGIFVYYQSGSVTAYAASSSSNGTTINVAVGTTTDLDVSIVVDEFGVATVTVNGVSSSATWSNLNGDQFIGTLGKKGSGISGSGVVMYDLVIDGIANLDDYPTAKAEYQFTENGVATGYKYYPYREDSSENYLLGVGFLPTDVSQTI